MALAQSAPDELHPGAAPPAELVRPLQGRERPDDELRRTDVDAPEVEIHDSRRFYALYGGGTAVAAAFCASLSGLGPILAVAFGVHAAWSWRRLFDRKPRIRVTAEGIVDDNFWYSPGLIRWDEIVDVRATRWGLIEIELADDGALWARLSPLRQAARIKLQLAGLGPAVITPWGFDRSRREVLAALKTALDRHELARFRREQVRSVAAESSDDRWSFETDRLHVARWPSEATRPGSAELPSVVARLLTPRVTAPLPRPWHGPYSEARASAWIRDRDAEGTTLLVADRATDDPVGLVLLHDGSDAEQPHTELRLGYLVAERLWGQGYATELVRGFVAWARHSPYRRIVAGVAAENAVSRRVLEKAGFARASRADADEVFYAVEV